MAFRDKNDSAEADISAFMPAIRAVTWGGGANGVQPQTPCAWTDAR